MYLNTVFLPLNIVVLYMSNLYECKKIYSNYTEEFINLAVISDYVYIGGKHSLIQLNSSLEIVNIKPKAGRNWLLTPYKTTLIACDYKGEYDSACTGYRSNLSIIEYEGKSIPIKTPHARYTTSTIGSDNFLTIASSDCLQAPNYGSCFAITNYKEHISDFGVKENYRVSYLNKTEKDKFNFNFRTVVGHGKYTYFLFVFNHTVSKLGKICNDANNNNNKLNAYEDVPISCSHNGVIFTTAQDLIFWNDDLLVVFTDGTASVICRFTNLYDNFEISRIERLKCPFKPLKNKYFYNASLPVCYNETVMKCQSSTSRDSFNCQEMTNGFCSPLFFSSIEGDVPMKGDVIYYSQNSAVGYIVKMTDVIVDKFVILYIGTSKGHIGKIFINDTDAFSLGDFKIVEWLSPVIDIKRDGENVYAMTKHVIANVADNADCRASYNCKDCMKSENPICGWDIITESCNKNFDKSFWVPSAGKKCLTIKSTGIAVDENDSISREAAISFELIPSIHLSELKYLIKINSSPETSLADVRKENNTYGGKYFYYKTDNVNVSYGGKYFYYKTDNVNVPYSGKNIYLTLCTFSFAIKESNLTDTRCRIQNVVSSHCGDKIMARRCTRSFLLNYIGNTTSIVLLNVTDRNGTEIASTPVILYKCGIAPNCTSCVQNRECYWCPLKVKCYLNGDGCNGMINATEEFKCPKINNSKNLLITYSTTKNLSLEVTNFEIYKNSNYIKCAVNSVRYDATVFNNTVVCQYIMAPNTMNTNFDVRLLYNETRLDGSAFLKVYKCENLDNVDGNCGYCKFWKGQGYDCDWCDNGCKSTVSGSCSSEWCNVSNEILNFTPNRSIIAGGRKIRITGQNMLFGSNGHMYNVKFCTNDSVSCIKCRDAKPAGQMSIMCRMDKSDSNLTLTNLIVIVDKDTPLNFSGMFYFVKNPTIIPLSPKNATVFRSGGIKITIKGKGFLDVGEVHVHNVENPCTISSDTSVVCETPPYASSDFARRKRSIGQNIVINYDDYQNLSTIYYIDNPFFEQLPLIEYDKESTILIKGRNLLDGARKDDYFVQIGLDGRCIVKKISNENITCLPPKEVPRTNHSDDNTVFIMVKVGRIREIIGNLKYVSEIPVMTIVIAVLATAFVAVVVIVTTTVLIIRQRKIKAEENFEMELISMEEKIRDASREEFADAQMTIRDIKTDLVTSNVPYFDYQSYAFHQLFPNQEMDTHRLLHEPMITDDKRTSVQKAMVMFDKLMTNKLFLKSLVQTLEHQNSLTLKDKANFASILSVAVLGNMRLFYQLVSCLLSDMIQSAPKKQHKVLFRRFESITQRLMVNWLEMSLYAHLKDGSGMQLFMLYKATQTVIEKAPIDAITGNSRNTLAEERLLKNRVEYETMTLNIDLNGNSDEKIHVSVLDCDTITQVKQKCITAIYKNKPASEVPSPHELELEWHHGKSGKLTLQDIDNISDHSNGMLRLNILKHYMVKDGNVMALMYKEDDDDQHEKQNIQNTLLLNPDHIKLQIPEEQEMHRWHLSNLTDEEKSNKEHEIGELFLNRLFQTKLILRDYIDAAFEGMMDSLSLPVPVRYFLCMLDKQGKDIGVDNDVLQAWKSECYGTRVWASLISKPQILFDVDVPSHVEPCMDILRQVFIDSFTLGTQNVSKESSTQKLLFHKDVAEYRKSVNTLFLKVEMVSDQEFWGAMDDMSTVQTREMRFNREATLQQLISFISRYEEEIIEDFAENDEIKHLEFGKQLKEIVNLMES